MRSEPAPTDEWLLRRYRSCGDRGARERLTARLLPLARGVARQYRQPRHEADLQQAASLGLAKAIDRWDERHGRSLRTYALPTMHGEVKRWLRDNAWPVHMPRRVQEGALRAMHASETLRGRLGRAPTVPEIAEIVGVTTEDVLESLHAGAAFTASSLDAPVAPGERPRLIDVLGGEEDARLERCDEVLSLRGLGDLLSETERLVLRLRFIDDLTQSQIAVQIGCSQMQVSRILRRCLDRLASAAKASGA